MPLMIRKNQGNNTLVIKKPVNRVGDTMTMAVDIDSGKMAQEIRDTGTTINTSTHNLKDHKYILKEDGWYDVGEVNNENKYPATGSLAPDYVQKKYSLKQTESKKPNTVLDEFKSLKDRVINSIIMGSYGK